MKSRAGAQPLSLPRLGLRHLVLYPLLLRLFLSGVLPFLLDSGTLIPGLRYTDVDYAVYTDAAALLKGGGSPYDRPTYRYTPFLAHAIRIANAPWNAFWDVLLPGRGIFVDGGGRVLFVASDALCGYLVAVLRARVSGDGAGQWDLLWWAYNPVAIVICTRGSCESFLVLLPVLTAVWLALAASDGGADVGGRGRRRMHRSAALIGVALGIAAHNRLYPAIYIPAFMAYLSRREGAASGAPCWAAGRSLLRSFPWTRPRTLASYALLWVRRAFGVPSSAICLSAFLVTFCGTWAAAKKIHGHDALHHGLLYHLGRMDNRHNYSPFWYWIYLAGARCPPHPSRMSAALSAFSSLPQLAVILLTSVGLAPDDLPVALLVQTLFFVAANRVATAQYLTWWMALLPLCAGRPGDETGMGTSREHRRLIAPGLGTVVALAGWSTAAYGLEMGGLDNYLLTWGASVAYWAANVWFIVAFLGGTQQGGLGRVSGKSHCD
mmetsp:Transcript_12445/g.24797  ORF Transcript_12445/g.24797 Transcript_12445/m.24797 type:complete len:492 (+) Transcript_12445:90-1565(+)